MEDFTLCGGGVPPAVTATWRKISRFFHILKCINFFKALFVSVSLAATSYTLCMRLSFRSENTITRQLLSIHIASRCSSSRILHVLLGDIKQPFFCYYYETAARSNQALLKERLNDFEKW